MSAPHVIIYSVDLRKLSAPVALWLHDGGGAEGQWHRLRKPSLGVGGGRSRERERRKRGAEVSAAPTLPPSFLLSLSLSF